MTQFASKHAGASETPDAPTAPGTRRGWAETGHDDPKMVEQRHYLAANNGIRGIETFQPNEIESIVRVFRRDGFVVVADVLTNEEVGYLKAGCDAVVDEILALDPGRLGNRGSHRYSFGAASITGSQLHRPEWRMLLDLPTLTPVVTAIFGSDDYLLRGSGGDFCLPGAFRYQPLHSDLRDWESAETTPVSSFRDPRGQLSTRELPTPHLCANFLTVDATPINGATRQIPGTQHSREPFPTLDEEPEWMKLSAVCPAPAGSVLLRDVRAWHGGTPNLSDEVRSIPNVEFFAPWFREPTTPCMSYRDYQTLSEHGKKLARFHVLDSSEELKTAAQIGMTPPRLTTATSPDPGDASPK